MTEVQGYYLIHYLYTYDHGFIARGLLGEILSWFFDVITPELTRWIIFTLSCLLIFSASLCIGKALNKAKSNDSFFVVFLIIAVICLLPFTFRSYLTDVKLDKTLWFLTLFAVFLSDRKIGICFTPFFCFAATLVNPVFLFCSMILIAVILLQKFYDSHYAVKNGLICLISYIGMIVIGIFGVISEKYLGFSTPEELVNYYFSRYGGVISEYDMREFCTTWLFDYFEPMKRCFQLAYKYYFVGWGGGITSIFSLLFYGIPSFVLLGIFWKKVMNHSDNRFQKFIFFLCLISPIVVIPATLISWEGSKYYGNNVVVQLCLIVFYLCNGNQAVTDTVNEFKALLKNNLAVSLIGIGYFGMLFFRFS